MDITQLPGYWRGLVKFTDVAKGEVFQRCAAELEMAYHEHAHDGEFYTGCRFCDWEREHEDSYSGEPDGP